jgi:hypothetical protein
VETIGREVNVTDYLRKADALESGTRPPDSPVYSPLVPAPGPLHIALVDLLENMLTMMDGFARTSGKVPTPLRAMGRTLKTLKPMMLEELGAVPEEEIRKFLQNVIVGPIQVVIETDGVSGNGQRKPT